MDRGTRPSRIFLSLAALITGLSFTQFPATAAKDLPPIKVSATNTVPTCVTPARLTAFLKSRNPSLHPRYEVVAQEYKRHGEALGIRWDFAFFQMLLETGNLKYTGDVKPEQNNFAGLGATGNGARGESFPDISTGVRAHLEHLLLYSGAHVEKPVAERTRNIQEWGVLTDWQKSISGPITFAHMSRKWAPTYRSYAREVYGISEKFADGPCREPEPAEQVAAKTSASPKPAPAETATTTPAAAPPPSASKPAAGLDIAAAASANSSEAAPQPSAGAASISKSAEGVKSAAVPGDTPAVKIINAPTDTPAADAPPAATGAPASADKPYEVAGPATSPAVTAPLAKPETPKTERCRVFTASYGGQKSIIIKAIDKGVTNYTVLDVNDGAEKREAEAYISAYAKGGETVGEFPNQNAALDKAFELCPER